MKANRILQCESELKRLKRTLKRLKQQSVTVTLTGVLSNHSVNVVLNS